MSFFSWTKRKTIILALLVVVIIVSVYGVFQYTKAQGLLPFGGLVTSYFWCEGNEVMLVNISGPFGGQFTYIPGSQAFESFNLGGAVDIWSLGLYVPNAAVCFDDDFDEHGAPRGTISPTVGTSIAF